MAGEEKAVPKIYAFMTGKFEEKDGQTRFEVLAITQDGNLIVDDWAESKEEAMVVIGAAPDSDNRLANRATFEATYPDGYDLEWVDTGDLSENEGARDAVQKMEARENDDATKPEQPKARQGTVTLPLACPVPDVQVADYGRKLAKALAEIDQATQDLKDHTKEAKGEIAEMEKEARSLRRAVTEQVMDDDVECRVDYNWDSGMKEIYRMDTGEFVRGEEITDDERQEALDMDGNQEPEEEATNENEPEEGGENGLDGQKVNPDANGMDDQAGNDDQPGENGN